METRRAGEPQWLPVQTGAAHCPGDAVRLGRLSRAAIALREGGVVRLDQNTTITFTPPPDRGGTWVDVLTGAAHFFTRTPRRLRITTPFVNGSVEGTEFLVEVEADEARISVWEGRVLAENAQGSLSLAAGQSAAARAGQAPDAPADRREARRRRGLGSPLPPVLDLRPGRLPRPARRDVAAAGPPLHRGSRPGDLAAALDSVAAIPEPPSAILGCSRTGPACSSPSDESTRRFPPSTRRWPSRRRSGDALALRSVVALARNDRALARSPGRAGGPGRPGIGRRQAGALLRPAGGLRPRRRVASVQQAVQLRPGQCPGPCAPGGALAARSATSTARAWPPPRRRPRPRSRPTRESTERARLHRPDRDPAPRGCRGVRAREAARSRRRPCPGSGSGLDARSAAATSRKAGASSRSRSASIPATPSCAAISARPTSRSAGLAARASSSSRERWTRNDPTPWLYDAIRLQSDQPPRRGARCDLERSIELNDNRAVYRSPDAAGRDRAATSASLGADLRRPGLPAARARRGMAVRRRRTPRAIRRTGSWPTRTPPCPATRSPG